MNSREILVIMDGTSFSVTLTVATAPDLQALGRENIDASTAEEVATRRNLLSRWGAGKSPTTVE